LIFELSLSLSLSLARIHTAELFKPFNVGPTIGITLKDPKSIQASEQRFLRTGSLCRCSFEELLSCSGLCVSLVLSELCVHLWNKGRRQGEQVRTSTLRSTQERRTALHGALNVVICARPIFGQDARNWAPEDGMYGDAKTPPSGCCAHTEVPRSTDKRARQTLC
jgi:hypothetical protein